MKIFDQIIAAKAENRKLLAVLMDPDKLTLAEVGKTLRSFHDNSVDYLLVGGSEVEKGRTQQLVNELKKHSSIPVILFPGDYSQITSDADALLFLNLISGRNPEYLINQQVKSVPLLEKSTLEIIPTAYLLIDGGMETSVERISNTAPMGLEDEEKIINTAIAGTYMGNQMIYLEAGSGAKNPIPGSVISRIAKRTDVPVIVGGGIRSHEQLTHAFENGADMIVIGTALENNPNLLGQILNNEHFH